MGGLSNHDQEEELPFPCYLCVRGTSFDEDEAKMQEKYFRDRFIKDFENTGTLIEQHFLFIDPSQDFEQLTICEECGKKVYEKYKDRNDVEVRYAEHIYLEDSEHPISCNICDCDLYCEISDPDCPEELCEIHTKADVEKYLKWAKENE